ncbi:polysaccharide deacetylase family protein [Lacibacter sp.]|uniref:polysaccharide deacetylase family protein n=1 Tax=Lacibacter sp. TaxID=1915409 RepID=UPI002B4AD977|nr:polysaccharide deacetylase family protein [Lacibacter sp.]HLP35566.1 polysaccharide deacetylase family protein [Lacibacter sp.]
MKTIFHFLIFLCFIPPSGFLSAQMDQRIKVIREIPVLSYHNIYLHPPKVNTLYISVGQFALQMQELHNRGYNAVLPDQIEAFYKNGTALPDHPFLISFDDAHLEHYTLAFPVLEQYKFKAVFFVMTVCIDKNGFLSESQIADLSKRGHVIGAHTWDHPNMTKLTMTKWDTEVVKPKGKLESIINKPVTCFAFPYGAWNEQLLQKLHESGFATAFQLQGKLSNKYPLLTMRRMMVSGNTSPELLVKQMKGFFR